jgi:hypothetical protein
MLPASATRLMPWSTVPPPTWPEQLMPKVTSGVIGVLKLGFRGDLEPGAAAHRPPERIGATSDARDRHPAADARATRP